MLVIVVELSIVVVRGGKADFLVGLEPSLCRSTLESLTLSPSCSPLTAVRVLSVVMRVPRVVVRPIVLPEVLPTALRAVSPGSRKLVVFFVSISLPIRDGISDSAER